MPRRGHREHHPPVRVADQSYGLAMVALAVIGLTGLVAAFFLPATPVRQDEIAGELRVTNG